MHRYNHSFLFALLCMLLLCSSAQATILRITVLDNSDNSTIPHATVFLSGATIGKTDNNGQYLLDYPGLNDPLIRVSMTGYNEWEKTVNKNETSVLVNVSRKSLSLKFSLIDVDTLGPVYGANVSISTENLTQTVQTDVSGSAMIGVKAATLYSYSITAPDYQPRSGTIDVGIDNKEVQSWLLSSKRFSFVIKDRDEKIPVPDVEVRIDTVLAGKTDLRGIVTTPITRGKVYAIEIKKEGYQLVSESRSITDSDALYAVEISKAPVGAFIYAFDESHAPLAGADVYIHGTLSGTTNQYGRSNFPNLVTGSYPVEVRKSGYVTLSQTIVVSNQSGDYTFELSFENADLTIVVQDKDQKVVPNATIGLNGKTAGVTDDQGLYTARIKFNTLYNITASKDGYQPVSAQKQILRGNATTGVNLILEKNPDWGLITLIAIGIGLVLVIFAAIRMIGRRKRRHVMRRNEI